MFGQFSELGGAPSPASPLGGGSFKQVRKMFPPPPPPLQIFGNVRKCSENVRNWRGRSPNLPPVGGATRKCLEHVRNMFGNGGFPPSSRWWFLLK